MSVDERFESLLDDLSGFYRAWLAYLGLETGLLARLREASDGMTSTDLASAAGLDLRMTDGWARAAYAFGLLDVDFALVPAGDDDLAPTAHRFRLDPDLAAVLLDEARPEFLGGQVVFSVGASLDYGSLVDAFRTGRPVRDRSARFHRSVERLNAQDIALFFEQVLPELPHVRERLEGGADVLDVACGAGDWLVAMARAFPGIRALGVEPDAGWLERAQARLAEQRLAGRVRLELRDPAAIGEPGRFGLVHIQDVLHELPDPAGALRSAWGAVAPGGTLVVFDWCMPSNWEEYRTPHGELLWGYQLDELVGGTSLLSRRGFERLFAAAGLPRPGRLELEAGATVWVLEREDVAR